MGVLKVKTDPRLKEKFKGYPPEARRKLKHLRKLILETAEENDNILELEETLKWGEPSFLVKKGSTLRIDWKSKSPDQYAMYFKCTSKLVETIRVVFGETFKYEKNRAILFSMDDEVPSEELKECIEMALRYHHIKNEPLLGK